MPQLLPTQSWLLLTLMAAAHAFLLFSPTGGRWRALPDRLHARRREGALQVQSAGGVRAPLSPPRQTVFIALTPCPPLQTGSESDLRRVIRSKEGLTPEGLTFCCRAPNAHCLAVPTQPNPTGRPSLFVSSLFSIVLPLPLPANVARASIPPPLPIPVAVAVSVPITASVVAFPVPVSVPLAVAVSVAASVSRPAWISPPPFSAARAARLRSHWWRDADAGIARGRRRVCLGPRGRHGRRGLRKVRHGGGGAHASVGRRLAAGTQRRHLAVQSDFESARPADDGGNRLGQRTAGALPAGPPLPSAAQASDP